MGRLAIMFASTWRLQEFGNHYGDYGQYAMDGEVPWRLMDGMLCSGHKFRLVTCAVFKSWIIIIMDTVNNIYINNILYYTTPYYTILYYSHIAILPMVFNHLQSMRDLYTQPKDSHGMDDTTHVLMTNVAHVCICDMAFSRHMCHMCHIMASQCDDCHDFHDFTASWFEVSPWEDTGLPGMASAP